MTQLVGASSFLGLSKGALNLGDVVDFQRPVNCHTKKITSTTLKKCHYESTSFFFRAWERRRT